MLKLTTPLSESSELSQFKIGHSEVYQYDCTLMENTNLGSNDSCICGLFTISSNGVHGRAEYRMPNVTEHFDLIHWASVFMHLKGLSIEDAFVFIRSNNESWGSYRQMIAEYALLDLSANLQNPSNNLTIDRSFLFTRSQAYFSF